MRLRRALERSLPGWRKRRTKKATPDREEAVSFAGRLLLYFSFLRKFLRRRFFCNGRRAVSSGDLAVLFLALMRSRGRAFIHSLYRVAARD